jgi:hypothetical protein
LDGHTIKRARKWFGIALRSRSVVTVAGQHGEVFDPDGRLVAVGFLEVRE